MADSTHKCITHTHTYTRVRAYTHTHTHTHYNGQESTRPVHFYNLLPISSMYRSRAGTWIKPVNGVEMARESGLLSAVLLHFSCRLMISLSHVQNSLYTQKVWWSVWVMSKTVSIHRKYISWSVMREREREWEREREREQTFFYISLWAFSFSFL